MYPVKKKRLFQYRNKSLHKLLAVLWGGGGANPSRPPPPPNCVYTLGRASELQMGPVNFKLYWPKYCLFLKSTPGIYCVYMPLWHQLINQKPLFSISENYSQHCQTTLSWSKYYSLVSVGVNRSV